MTHPVDRLGEIRRQIRDLRKEAKTIVAKIDAGAIGSAGQCYTTTTYQTTLTHPIPQPAAPAHYQYQNPLQQNWQNQAQQGLNQRWHQDKAFGQGGFGHDAFGVGKREGGDD